jgi:hypothetical protein
MNIASFRFNSTPLPASPPCACARDGQVASLCPILAGFDSDLRRQSFAERAAPFPISGNRGDWES